MATSRVSHVLRFLLWISLLLFVSKCFFGSFSSITLNPLPSPVITSVPFFYRPGRRALALRKFDFTPFMNDLRRSNKVYPPGGSEIDPRYGFEKRIVPSGPNPLHH
ncbi:CLAVATA3/ESR (CLE)-related protein 13 [Cardamine amara subsp. amara]|uniref:CLAVATA3/ESR (CLE)-related protein 13 n=1 Tax=Cardamine amara subsp. amara TaxID=228776 RepID=A0ABD1BE22_CARAN